MLHKVTPGEDVVNEHTVFQKLLNSTSHAAFTDVNDSVSRPVRMPSISEELSVPCFHGDRSQRRQKVARWEPFSRHFLSVLKTHKTKPNLHLAALTCKQRNLLTFKLNLKSVTICDASSRFNLFIPGTGRPS